MSTRSYHMANTIGRTTSPGRCILPASQYSIAAAAVCKDPRAVTALRHWWVVYKVCRRTCVVCAYDLRAIQFPGYYSGIASGQTIQVNGNSAPALRSPLSARNGVWDAVVAAKWQPKTYGFSPFFFFFCCAVAKNSPAQRCFNRAVYPTLCCPMYIQYLQQCERILHKVVHSYGCAYRYNVHPNNVP